MNSIKKIAVIGLGYVGLPLALLAEEKKFEVIGIDLNKDRIKQLQEGESPINEPRLVDQMKNSKIEFTSDFNKVSTVDAVIVCVPTPVDETKTPDLGPVIGAVKSSVPLMKKGSLLIIESTINPGVCNEVLIPLIESETKHKVGKTLHLAHCPERINPGDPKWHVGNINRVLGAESNEGLVLAYDFYTRLVDAEVKKMGSLKEAEAVKIVENSFRDVNIAFVNELAMSFEKLGINVNNVIDGAATKPFAFMAHYPGIGVGGHCIPVDPYYLIEYAKDKGFNHEFLKLARSINEGMPKHALLRIEMAYKKKHHKSIKGAKVTLLGLSYKPNVADDRESPSYALMEILKIKGVDLCIYDPHYPGKSTVSDLASSVEQAECIIIAVAHDEFMSKLPDLIPANCILLDGRNCLKQTQQMKDKSIEYLGVGI